MYIRSITRYTKYNHVYTEYNLVYTDMYSYIPGQAHQRSNRQRQGELSSARLEACCWSQCWSGGCPHSVHGLEYCHSPVSYSRGRAPRAAQQGCCSSRPPAAEPAWQDRGKGEVEFREGPQHSAQGPGDHPVGQFGQHLVSSTRGLWYTQLYCDILRYTAYIQW